MTFFLQLLPSFMEGTKQTLLYFGITLLLSLPLAISMVLLRISSFKPLRMIMQFYIYIMQGTPLMLQLVFVYFGLPYLGVTFSREIAAGLAFILNYTAYFIEIFRGGIQSIPKGQWEACQVLGLSKWHSYRRIILPQVLKRTLPAVGNECLTLLKDTALISVLGLNDVLKVGKGTANQYATAVPFLFVGGIYLVLSAVLSYVLKKGEKHYEYHA